MKVDGKMKPIGKIYDRDHIGYGSYFITNTKYGRSMNWIGAAPDPDFIRLETAVEESRENLKIEVRKIIEDFIDSDHYFKYDYETIDKIIQAIRKTYLDKKERMLKMIAQ